MSNPTEKLTHYETRIYKSVVERAKLVGISIDKLCRSCKVAPSTFSRWKNGHCSGLLRTLGKMDYLLNELELIKLSELEVKAKALRFSFNDICDEAGIYYLDVTRWKRKTLPVDYKKLEEINQIILGLEAQNSNNLNKRVAK